MKAASAAAAGTELLSAPVAVGKARFVGVSWPAPAVGPQANLAGEVWLRVLTAAGWSGWRAVEPAADGPDANTAEYRRAERVYSEGQWLDAGTAEVQLRVDQPAPATAAPSGAVVPQTGVQAHLITPDMTATPGTEAPRAGVAAAATARPAIVSRKGGGRWSRCGGPGPATARPSRRPSSTTRCRPTATPRRRAPPWSGPTTSTTCAAGAGTTSATTSWSTATAACSRAATATPPAGPTGPSGSGRPATATGRRLERRPGLHPGGPAGHHLLFRNSTGSGPSELHTSFGRAGDLGFVGDWNGNGTWTPGVLRGGARWYLKNSFTGTTAAVGLAKQTPGTPVVGDWDNRP